MTRDDATVASDREPPPPVRGRPGGLPHEVLAVTVKLVHRDGKLGHVVEGLPEVRHPLGDIESELEVALERTLALWRRRMTAAWLDLGR